MNKLINDAKVLMVGTGGIGCELLKCLALAGFKSIDIVDMDTIEISNLNRQFLFRKEHVGRPKVEVAKESMKEYFPDININTHFVNIINEDFPAKWFKQFTFVLNALDNVSARAHVNRMCLVAEVPLFDSGTSGFEGQTEPYIKGMTRCYECEVKPEPKTYPSCTIRNTPTESIHCIVWAKNLFAQLFGEEDADSEVSPDTADPELAGSALEKTIEDSAKSSVIERVSTKKWAQDIGYEPKKLFNKFFKEDILYLLKMKSLWEKRIPPEPLVWDKAITEHSVDKVESECVMEDQKLWSIAKCTEIFENACENLKNKLSKLKESGEKPILFWDKDEKYDMDFVTACANIRCHVFHIRKKSRYDVKSMAGNIVPAVATSNAIIAGLVVFQIMHILRNNPEKCRIVYLREFINHEGIFISPEKNIHKPNPNCLICSTDAEATLYVDINKVTIKQLYEDVFKKYFKMVEPEVIIKKNKNIIIYPDQDMEDEFVSKNLSQVGISEGVVLSADDYFQSLKFDVYVKELELDEQSRDKKELFKVVRNEKKPIHTENGTNGEVNSVETGPSTSNEHDVQNNDGSVDDEDDDLIFVSNAYCHLGKIVVGKSERTLKTNSNEVVSSAKRSFESVDISDDEGQLDDAKKLKQS